MSQSRYCDFYYNDIYANYLIEYRGNFKEQIDKIPYACGDTITRTLGVISVDPENLDRLLIDVPSIILVELRSMYVLQQLPPSISPSDVDNIMAIKINPYLGLSGLNVLIGIVDTGIDYLNDEFINEDGTSRIQMIWDQSIKNNEINSVYIGKTYSKEDINKAITAFKSGTDPYAIVPSKDDVGHGTKIANIIGGKGYKNEVEGIAPDCEFVVVKLMESSYNKKILNDNGVPYIPTYNDSELLAGVEFLKNYSLKVKKPMVISICIGTTEKSHSGNSLMSRYMTTVASNRGIIFVAGTGNEGDSEGHISGLITSKDTNKTIELSIPKELKYFRLSIWMQRPSIISVNTISPSGEMTDYVQARPGLKRDYKFIYTDTKFSIRYYLPDAVSGEENIVIIFGNIKPGIWKLQLKLETIIGGNFHIWLSPKETLPPNTIFLESNPFTTLTVPSSARKVITVAYYNSINKSLVSASGKGFNTNNLINPDITTGGINILTTTIGNKITTFSGSSAATAITAGICALLLQWGIIDGNDITMYSIKMRSYLLYGADRESGTTYPNRTTGYGFLNILGTLNTISGSYRMGCDEEIIEYYSHNLFIRIPREIGGDFYGDTLWFAKGAPKQSRL